MPKSVDPIDILVLGEHPATYLAAMLVAKTSKLRVLHATMPHDAGPPDRVVILNPSLFELHPLLVGLAKKIELSPVHVLRLLSDESSVRSEHQSRTAMVHVANYEHVRVAMKKLAVELGVTCVEPKSLRVQRLDESGADVTIGRNDVRVRMLLVGGQIDDHHRRMIGPIDAWDDAGVLHRVTFAKLKAAKWLADAKAKSAICMSLDLRGTLWWAWLIPHKTELQLSVAQPVASAEKIPPRELLNHWAKVLQQHGVLREGGIAFTKIDTMDLPLAGALAHEGVANRTLLIGPAGGFYSACAEDIYPNCWSTIFAVECAAKALGEKHLQDALGSFRHQWRTTLGDYLRGPQQNLRFLLPMVYRNATMTSRLAESILLGKSVVRNEE